MMDVLLLVFAFCSMFNKPISQYEQALLLVTYEIISSGLYFPLIQENKSELKKTTTKELITI